MRKGVFIFLVFFLILISLNFVISDDMDCDPAIDPMCGGMSALEDDSNSTTFEPVDNDTTNSTNTNDDVNVSVDSEESANDTTDEVPDTTDVDLSVDIIDSGNDAVSQDASDESDVSQDGFSLNASSGILGLSWLWIIVIASSILFFILLIIIILIVASSGKKKKVVQRSSVTPVRTAPVAPLMSSPLTPAPVVPAAQSQPAVSSQPSAHLAPQMQPQVSTTPPAPQMQPQVSTTPPAPQMQPQVSTTPPASVVSTAQPQISTQSQPTVTSNPSSGVKPQGVQFVKYYAQNLSHDPRVRIDYLLNAGKKYVDSGDKDGARQIYSFIFEDYNNLHSHDNELFNKILQFRQSIE